ncbi:MAG: adenylate/guanylate cyclase domain-containing protein [Planctomycetota bacterium]
MLLGRAPSKGWRTPPNDKLISREHAEMSLAGGVVTVRKLESARNPIFFGGRTTDEIRLEPGESFRIGATRFEYLTESKFDQPDSTFTEHLMRPTSPTASLADPVACLEALCKMPELIAETATDELFAERAVDLLLDSVRGSLAAAVMHFDERATDTWFDSHGDMAGDSKNGPRLIRWASRDEQMGRFRPSRRLVRRALESRESVVHLWIDDPDAGGVTFTLNNDMDWAFCTPIEISEVERWCLYVSGKRHFPGLREVETPSDLIGELRLAELIARFIGAVRRVRTLEYQHVAMRPFFPARVIEAVTLNPQGVADPLEPRLGPVSVLFCDVRGFSRKAERSSADLEGLLEQVSRVLTEMTHGIRDHEGVVADFQGDAALGFWGWPTATPEAALLACRAALQIAAAFERARHSPSNSLHGYHVGVGVTFGEALAGRIGSADQIKVGVFGPVVNLASRLQDLTKQLGVPVLVDERVVEEVGDTLSGGEGFFRRLARLRPPGMEMATDVYSLTPAESESRMLSHGQLKAYDDALDAITSGDWQAAGAALEPLAPIDPPSQFLLTMLRSADLTPPEGWDGALSMAGKGELRLR